MEAAKKEGKVVWYTSLALPSAEKVAKLFEAAYPGIKVEVHRTGSQRILQRVMQELQANIKNVDVVHTSDAGHFVLLKEKKLLARHTPAGVERFPAGFKDKDGYYYGLRATVNVIAYNTQKVTAAEAPKTWKDLLDPEVEGQDGHRASRLQRRHRHPRARARAPPRLGVLPGPGEEPAHAGAVGGGSRGRGGLGRAAGGGRTAATTPSTSRRSRAIRWRSCTRRRACRWWCRPSAITSFAPHPNAARLFTDFSFTREVQQVMADSEGLYTGHPDVKYPADKPKLTDLKLLTAEPEELEKRNEEIKKRFVEFFGA